MKWNEIVIFYFLLKGIKKIHIKNLKSENLYDTKWEKMREVIRKIEYKKEYKKTEKHGEGERERDEKIKMEARVKNL